MTTKTMPRTKTPKTKSTKKPATPVRLVVSRNYLDGPEKYAARELEKSEAKPYSKLILKNVNVRATYDDYRYRVERDFGCAIILVGDKAKDSQVSSEARPFRFDGVNFVDNYSNRLTSMSKVWLTKDGMFYLP